MPQILYWLRFGAEKILYIIVLISSNPQTLHQCTSQNASHPHDAQFRGYNQSPTSYSHRTAPCGSSQPPGSVRESPTADSSYRDEPDSRKSHPWSPSQASARDGARQSCRKYILP